MLTPLPSGYGPWSRAFAALSRRALLKMSDRRVPVSQVVPKRIPDCGGALFDLGFLEFDVLAHDRIVAAEAQLLGGRAGVLLGDVEVAGARRGEQLDLLDDLLGHECGSRVLTVSANRIGQHTDGAFSVKRCAQ